MMGSTPTHTSYDGLVHQHLSMALTVVMNAHTDPNSPELRSAIVSVEYSPSTQGSGDQGYTLNGLQGSGEEASPSGIW